MPMFRLTGPDGSSYDVTAPDENAAAAAFGQLHGGERQLTQPADATPQDPGFLANAIRALTTGANPFQDRMVAATKTVLPEALGGSPGFEGYAANLEQERAANEQLRAEHPTLANLGQGIGAALSSLAVPAAALGRYAQGTGALGRVALGAAAGSGVGAVQRIGASPDLANAGQTFESGISGAAGGSVLGAVFPAAGAAIGKAIKPLAAALRKGPGTADLERLQTAKQKAYQDVEDIGAKYSPDAYGTMVKNIASDADDNMISARRTPKAASIIKDLRKDAERRRTTENDPGTPISLTELDKWRQVVNREIVEHPDASERYFGAQIKNSIDEFIANAGPREMAAGAPEDAASAIRHARDIAMRQFKAKALRKALDKAEIRAASTGTGGNIENTTRQRLAAILEQEPWSADEKAQLMHSIMGGVPRNALRQISRLSPVGNALTTLLESGGAVYHPELVGAGALAGAGAQGLEAMLRRNARNNLMATILAGGKATKTVPLLSGNYPRVSLAATAAANENLTTRRRQSLPP